MKKSVIQSTAVLLFSILLVSGVNAQQYRYPAADRLDLTEEQQEKIEALRMEHYQTMKPLRNQMAELRVKERTLMSQEEIDLEAVKKVIDEQTETTNQMRKNQLEHRVAIRGVLTGEQLLKLEMERDRRQEFRSRRSNRWGNDHRGSLRGGRPYHRGWS